MQAKSKRVLTQKHEQQIESEQVPTKSKRRTENEQGVKNETDVRKKVNNKFKARNEQEAKKSMLMEQRDLLLT